MVRAYCKRTVMVSWFEEEGAIYFYVVFFICILHFFERERDVLRSTFATFLRCMLYHRLEGHTIRRSSSVQENFWRKMMCSMFVVPYWIFHCIEVSGHRNISLGAYAELWSANRCLWSTCIVLWYRRGLSTTRTESTHFLKFKHGYMWECIFLYGTIQ